MVNVIKTLTYVDEVAPSSVVSSMRRDYRLSYHLQMSVIKPEGFFGTLAYIEHVPSGILTNHSRRFSKRVEPLVFLVELGLLSRLQMSLYEGIATYTVSGEI